MPYRFFAAALLAAAAPIAVQAQERDLDNEPTVGKVFTGEVAEGGGPAQFLLTLRGGQAIDLTAAQVGGSDPALKVYDTATRELIAENDDAAGSLAANVRLFSETTRRLRIEVSNAAVDPSPGPMRFDLVLRPSDYRPKPVRPITIGEELTGTLERNDEQLFRFHGERGQQWTFGLNAALESTLDPALQVFAGDRATGTPVGSDDDGGGELNAKLEFVVPQTGDYLLRAYPVGTSEGGYTLTTTRETAPPPAKLADIDLDTTVTGRISGGAREQVYQLSAAARRALAANPGPLVVEMNFTGEAEGAVDPVVAVGFDTPLGFSAVATDDDGAGQTNARLTVDGSMLTPTWLEALRIKASGFLETSGPYELKVSRGEGE